MSSNVIEIQGSGRLPMFKSVIVDAHLIFPNVLTCVAIIAHGGTNLYGIHATTAHRGKMKLIRELLTEEGCVTPKIYVVGPVKGYHLMGLLPLGAVGFYDCEGGIDVEAKLDDELLIGTRPNSGGNFTQIPLSDFQY